MQRRSSLFLLIGIPLLLGASAVYHIDLRESFPKADQLLEEAPQEIWLEFSVQPDTSRSTFTLRGPSGGVALSAILWNATEDPTFLRANVEGEMLPGAYTIAWVAAPLDDHGDRGQIKFTIGGGH